MVNLPLVAVSSGCLLVVSHADFADKKEAFQRLRQRRSNDGFFEELKAGNMERECNEEQCSYDEFTEIFDVDDDNQQARNDMEVQWNQRVSQCGFLPCHNRHTIKCINKWNDYECVCKSGWTNVDDVRDCSVDVDECESDGFCRNGGLCQNTEGGYNCDCADGWTGGRCEEDINECDENPCQNGGECTNTEGGFECSCPTGWQGLTCGEDVDECADSYSCARENQYCVNTVGSFMCACTGGYAGDDCSEDLDECATLNPCKHGAICSTPRLNMFVCSCPDEGCANFQEPVVEELVVADDTSDTDEVADDDMETVEVPDMADVATTESSDIQIDEEGFADTTVNLDYDM